MIALYINQLPAVIKSGTSIKLTRENPYFTSSGDYTLDVVLPLSGCMENLKILGALHRPEASLAQLAGKHLEMQLVTDLCTLSGYAVITSVSQEEAKLQLVAGRSAFDKAIEDTDVYIDRMDLGKAWDIFPDRLPYSVLNGDGSNDTCSKDNDPFDHMPCYIRSLYAQPAYGQEAVRMVRGEWPKTDCVLFPIYSTESNTVCNEMSLDDVDGKVWMPRAELSGGNHYFTPCAPQPYLLDVVRRVITAAGYTPDLSEFEASGSIVTKIIVANVRCTPYIAQMLPHWTLREFVEAVQNATGTVFVLEDRTVRLMTRAGWYARTQPVELTPVDEHTAELDSDEDSQQRTSSAGNVGYDFPEEDAQLCLPDEVWEYAAIEYYNTYEGIQLAASNIDEEERKKSRVLYVNRTDGRAYAYLHNALEPDKYNLRQVNQYGPLIRNAEARDNVTKLKLVPTTMKLYGMGYPNKMAGNVYDTLIDGSLTYIPILTSSVSHIAGKEAYSIDLAINNTEDKETQQDYESSKQDMLPIAWWDGISTCRRKDDYTLDAPDSNIPLAVGLTFIQHKDEGHRILMPHMQLYSALPPEGPFMLCHGNGSPNYHLSSLFSGAATIDTRTEHVFSFTERAADPQRPYLIRGRLYACNKIEMSLSTDGVEPLKKGYFYEILS